MSGQLTIILLPARQNGTRVTVEGRWALEESRLHGGSVCRQHSGPGSSHQDLAGRLSAGEHHGEEPWGLRPGQRS